MAQARSARAMKTRKEKTRSIQYVKATKCTHLRKNNNLLSVIIIKRCFSKSKMVAKNMVIRDNIKLDLQSESYHSILAVAHFDDA